jgi:multiple sugar transport system ATP-binding protein
VREPESFLMDEPLSNLDAKLRVGMRASLAQLHAKLGITTVYVTHDQTEAMTLGTRVAVMRDGKIVQVAEPQVLYTNPVDLFVAAFIGSPAMNLVEVDPGDELCLVGTRSRSTATAARRATSTTRSSASVPRPRGRPGSPPRAPASTCRVEVVEEPGADTLLPGRRPRVTAESGREEDDDAHLFAEAHAFHGARRTRTIRATEHRSRPRSAPTPLLRSGHGRAAELRGAAPL